MDGYVFLPGSAVVEMTGIGADLRCFAAAWDRLPPDPYLPRPAPYRFRRHGRVVFDCGTGALAVLPPGEYLQAESHNPLFGGVPRRFAPLVWDGPTGRVLAALVGTGAARVLGMSGRVLANLHQIRVVGGPGLAGTPVPEGRHRDGYHYISIHLIGRDVDGGGHTTLVADADQARTTVTLVEPMDSVFVDDRRFTHDTSAIEGHNRTVRRDVLLMSFEPAPP